MGHIVVVDETKPLTKAAVAVAAAAANKHQHSHAINSRHHHHHHNHHRLAFDTVTNLLRYAVILCLTLSVSLLLFPSLFTRPPLPSLDHHHWWSSTDLLPSSSSSSIPTCQPDTSRAPTNLSHILFSLGGSAATWHARRNYSELWWSPSSSSSSSSTRGYVWLDSAPSSWPDTSPPYRISSSSSSSSTGGGGPSPHVVADRVARIVKESFDLGADGVRWFVMGDDDTVFFKENLVTVLSKYDHRKMYYVGETSESVEQVEMHSYRTAFGGGGFAVSYGLACWMSRMMDGCVRRYESFWGSDEKVSACIGELGVPLTRESGFHQLDIRGDPYGLMAAHPIAPLVSLHHLDFITPLFPHQTQLDSLKTLMKAYAVDPARIMQQSICHDRYRKWSLSVSWGYTVQLHPALVSSRELEMPLQTFKTWRSWRNGPFTFNTRPSEDDPCRRPIVFFLDRVHQLGDGRSLTRYKRVKGGGRSGTKEECGKKAYKYARGVEFVTVVAEKMDPQEWLTSPRRQCCEMRNGWFLKKNMQVVVRSCKSGETITP